MKANKRSKSEAQRSITAHCAGTALRRNPLWPCRQLVCASLIVHVHKTISDELPDLREVFELLLPSRGPRPAPSRLLWWGPGPQHSQRSQRPNRYSLPAARQMANTLVGGPLLVTG